MAFASIYVPDFMVQSVVRGEPPLRGRAVALIQGAPPLSSVVAANEAAWLAGIELGMNKSQAADFGTVEIRPRSPAQEKAAHAALLDLGWSVSPRVEDAAPDAIILDLAGLASIFGPEEKIAAKLVEHASKLGLSANVAVASNIESALHAARGFSGITVIPPGEEARRLGCLPVSALLPSAEIMEILERWGVRNCAAVAALPVLELSERLGQEGVRLHELARGARERSLTLAEPAFFFRRRDGARRFGRGARAARVSSRPPARSIVRAARGAFARRVHDSSAIRSGAILRKRFPIAERRFSPEGCAENLLENPRVARAHARFQNAFEIAALAFATGSSARAHIENHDGGRSRATTRGAGWTLSSRFARSGKTGAYGCANRESGGRGKYRIARIDGHAPARRVSYEPVRYFPWCGGESPQERRRKWARPRAPKIWRCTCDCLPCFQAFRSGKC